MSNTLNCRILVECAAKKMHFVDIRKRRNGPRTIALIVVLTIAPVILFFVGCYLLKRKSRKSFRSMLRENFGQESATLEPLQFDLAVIEAATNKFSNENFIGKGGFGEVYK
ncbi:cysteine-rich receptor-like protein kinase, partial [Trifolium medium]|nr:cysteine-rich receptor-like protein kinase [Trifolium medium]